MARPTRYALPSLVPANDSMARDPKRKVALKIENKRRFSGHEDCGLLSEMQLVAASL